MGVTSCELQYSLLERPVLSHRSPEYGSPYTHLSRFEDNDCPLFYFQVRDSKDNDCPLFYFQVRDCDALINGIDIESMTCVFPDVLDNLTGSDANYEMVTLSTIASLKLVWSAAT